MDNWTARVLLEKVKNKGVARFSFDTLSQTFGSETEFKRFVCKHKLRYSIGTYQVVIKRR